ncbi:MAG: hypothetical protein AAF745_07620 [Planctomycetota bacterium]
MTLLMLGCVPSGFANAAVIFSVDVDPVAGSQSTFGGTVGQVFRVDLRVSLTEPSDSLLEARLSLRFDTTRFESIGPLQITPPAPLARLYGAPTFREDTGQIDPVVGQFGQIGNINFGQFGINAALPGPLMDHSFFAFGLRGVLPTITDPPTNIRLGFFGVNDRILIVEDNQIASVGGDYRDEAIEVNATTIPEPRWPIGISWLALACWRRRRRNRSVQRRQSTP